MLASMWLYLLFGMILPSPAPAQSPGEAAERVFHALESLRKFPAKESLAPKEPQRVVFIKLDPEDPWSLGVLRIMRIAAPVERMVSVLDDVPGYVGLFKDLLEARKTPLQAPHEFEVYTETRIPIPFVANDRTSVRYRNRLELGRRLSSYALVESNHLSGLEGASLLLPDGAGGSLYWQLGLIKVGYGAARALPAKTFWAQNAIGSLQADFALRLRAEDPHRDSSSILKDSGDAAWAEESRVRDAFASPLTLDSFIKDLESRSPP